jgi:hypothetical protein
LGFATFGFRNGWIWLVSGRDREQQRINLRSCSA